jgi:hypothetical protein
MRCIGCGSQAITERPERAIRAELGKHGRHRISRYRNNGLEQDHRGLKGRYRDPPRIQRRGDLGGARASPRRHFGQIRLCGETCLLDPLHGAGTDAQLAGDLQDAMPATKQRFVAWPTERPFAHG